MRQDLYEDLYIKEQDYWWHVGKRAIVYNLLERFLPPAPAPASAGPDDSGRRALDLGCGAGLNLDHLARYARPVGTDFSEEALRFCLARGHRMLAKADAAELPFPDCTFDIITALDVIEHVDSDHDALVELRRVLRPGGLLIINVPAYPLLWSYWDDILGHRRRYTVRTLARAVARAGLRVRKVSYSNALILPPVILVRVLKGLLTRANTARGNGRDPETDFMPVPRWLNSALIAYYRREARWLRHRRLPFGLSVVCVAQRPRPLQDQAHR
jgi:SAM-dependent methyltransferase